MDSNNRVEKWGRLLGEVVFRGINVGEDSIRNGHAVSWEERKQSPFADFNKILEGVAV